MCITVGGAKRNLRITPPQKLSPARGEIINQHKTNTTIISSLRDFWEFFLPTSRP
ncbi:MAG: hypothetical protein LBU34_00650 [Planctomycetaceae bacterium]|nr:hypothetical protein [Planctomycetaceae bacterium]